MVLDGYVFLRASLVWPKLVWPNARLAETNLAEI
jgi:hypothetical protein